MKINFLLFLSILIYESVEIYGVTHCDIVPLIYYSEYGYGSNIRCRNLTESKTSLMPLFTNKLILLEIVNSNIQDAEANLFVNMKSLKIFNIVNSTFIFQKGENIFKTLERLEYLNVTNSKFGAITENTLNSQPYLKEIIFDNINLEFISDKSFKHLQNLENLYLCNNKIKTLESVPLCVLPKLKKLYLKNNFINNLHSSSFLCINFTTYLTNIDLSYNKLDGIFHSIDHLQFLKELNLEGNNIKSFEGYEFYTLQNLETLDLKNNLLNKIEHKLFKNLKKLNYINLENNKIRHVCFGELPNLKYVNLAKNKFFLNDLYNWTNLPSLEHLDLSSNYLQQIIEFPQMITHTLKYLNLSGNNININENTFKNLNNLESLSLSNSKLNSLPQKSIDGLKNLIHLDLSVNNFDNFKSTIFNNLTKLEFLNLSHNLFETIDLKMFTKLSSLEILDLEANKLRQLDFDVLSDIPMLNEINIEGNKFSCDFLTKLINFLNNKGISYIVGEMDNNYSSENVGGISCTNDNNNNNEINYSKYQASSNGMSFATVFFLVSFLIMIIGILSYKLYLFSKRRKYTIDEFELMED